MADNTQQGCLGAILRIFGIGPSRRAIANPTYRRKDYFFSKAEASFFGVLNLAVGDEFFIFAKVRLADLLFVPPRTAGWQGAFNRIQSKHVDFLLCQKNGVRPCLVIELNDGTHEEPDRRDRDAFLVKALSGAGLSLLQVKAANSYNVNLLKSQIEGTIRAGE